MKKPGSNDQCDLCPVYIAVYGLYMLMKVQKSSLVEINRVVMENNEDITDGDDNTLVGRQKCAGFRQFQIFLLQVNTKIKSNTDDDDDTGIFRPTREKLTRDCIKLKMAALRIVAPCSLVETETRFNGAQYVIFEVVAVRTSNLTY
jgi:hypothetical protein